MKRILSFAIIFIITICILPVYTAYAEEAGVTTTLESGETTGNDNQEGGSSDSGVPVPSAESAIVIDAKTGQILYEKNAHTKMYPASITKIMTAYLALENGDLNSKITMSEDAVWGIERGSSHIALDVDEQITLEDALYAVMLVSANEAAWGVAEHIGGSLKEFTDMMNSKAAELGCENTHFVNANGLHDDEHYTTAYDMALITKAALTNEKFMEITSSTYHKILPTNKNSEQRDLWQDNKLINPDSEYYYEYCQGGKTGYTDQAGGTLVTWAQKDDMQLICVTLNGSSALNYTDSAALLDYFFNNYSYQSPLAEYEFSAEELTRAQNYLNDYYSCENAGTMNLTVDTTKKILISNEISADKLDINWELSSERLSNSIIGTMTVSHGGDTYLELPVLYSGYVNSNDKDAVREAIANGTIRSKENSQKGSVGILIFIIILLLGIVSFVYLRIKYIKKQREAYLRRRERARRQRKHF